MRARLALLLSLLCVASGCAYMPAGSVRAPEKRDIIEIRQGEELFCLVENEEEAEQIAARYGIALVSCRGRTATFHTEEDPGTVIKRGRENGWKALTLNTIDKPFGRKNAE